MKFSHIFSSGIISCMLAAVTNAYDIGCLYPDNALDPWRTREELSNWMVGTHSVGTETPMVIRVTHYWGNCQALCVHYHDPRYADPFDQVSKWDLPIPPYIQNAFSIIMCIAQCDAHIVNNQYEGAVNEYVEWSHDFLKFQISDPNLPQLEPLKDGVLDYYETGNKRMLEVALDYTDYDPFVLGHIAGFYVMTHMNDDGWNQNGDLVYSRETDSVEPCTGSCRNYGDISGYTPVADPRTYAGLSDDSKYECTGLCRHWQPLQEGYETGSLFRQEHVTPHIGTYGHTWLRPVTSNLPDPEYDLLAESLDVIEELKITSGDDYRKVMTEYFDNKIKPRVLIRVAMRKYLTYDIPFQDYALFVYGLSMVEYDSVVQAWHEKVIHDYVRPTTIIKEWDSDILHTFGGDLDHDGPVDIAARDFEALIRVMPHAEFPSGSACLCKGYQEYTDEYTMRYHGIKLTDIEVDGTEFPDMTFEDMSEMAHVCSESRIWGGMHFKAAVPAGEEACSGLGVLGVDFIDKIKDDSIPFQGVLYYRDDPAPVCGEGYAQS